MFDIHGLVESSHRHRLLKYLFGEGSFLEIYKKGFIENRHLCEVHKNLLHKKCTTVNKQFSLFTNEAML